MKVSIFVSFGIGACVGGSLVYIFLKEKIRAEVERGNTELLDAMQKSMEDRYEARYNKKEETKEEKVENRPDTHPTSSIKKMERPKESTVTYNHIEKRASDILDEYRDCPFDTEEVTPIIKTEGPGPYMMAYDDMMEADKGYDLVVCHYYAADDDCLVTDDFGDPLSDPLHDIGWENLQYLRNVDKDVIYVRNDALSTDYEIYLSTVE